MRARILKDLGFDNALGLNQGGSTALWFGGYNEHLALYLRGIISGLI